MRPLSRRDDSIWHPSDWDRLADARWRQLSQNHLLVEALRRHPSSPLGKRGLLGLVRHPADKRCVRIAADYRTTLVSPRDTFVDLPLDPHDLQSVPPAYDYASYGALTSG